MPNSSAQGKYWLLTIPYESWQPTLPDSCLWIKGQAELPLVPDPNDETMLIPGYKHWQVVVCFARAVRLAAAKAAFTNDTHAELSRSAAANAYVHKEETAIPDTQFELGERPLKRNSKLDWAKIKQQAQQGQLEEIDAQVYVTHYSALKRIAADNMKPKEQTKEVVVYWGPTGVGKSRRVWELAGLSAYPKIPTTKWWDGYRPEDHANVVIDEFSGQIDITHMLRWCDRYPCVVETKGSSIVFHPKKIFITSNIDPKDWWPSANDAHKKAFTRRVTVIHVPFALYPTNNE